MPCMWSMSLWHMPTASTLSTAPPGGGPGTGSSRSSQVPSPGITTALLVLAIGFPFPNYSPASRSMVSATATPRRIVGV